MACGSDKRATLETAGKSRIQSRLKPTGITHPAKHTKEGCLLGRLGQDNWNACAASTSTSRVAKWKQTDKVKNGEKILYLCVCGCVALVAIRRTGLWQAATFSICL